MVQKLTGLVRRCVEDYEMIKPGENVAVGVSGGKDSLALLYLLAQLRSYMDFNLLALTVDMGLGMDYGEIENFCKDLSVPFYLVKTEIGPIIFDYRKEKNPCSMCAKMRRGALNQAVLDQHCSKIALGHHYDDAVETFMMSLIFEGRINCFQPVTNLDRTGVVQIRPMLYVHERSIENFAAKQNFPVLINRCPVDKHTKREEVKELLYRLSGEYPELRERIFGAMQRFPLPAWEPQGRYKRPHGSQWQQENEQTPF